MSSRPHATATRIWLARHGQTETNRAGVFCGHSETALTDLGRAQARALGRRLASRPIAAVYTSDFARALDTAAIALEGRDLTPNADPDLRELNYGEWEQRRESEIRRDYPDQHRLMRAEDPAWRPPGGETIGEVRARTYAALKRIVARHRHQEVLVVSHGTALNCMLSEVLAVAPTHNFRFDIANCGLSLVTTRGHHLVVVTLNDTSHLEDVSLPLPSGPAK